MTIKQQLLDNAAIAVKVYMKSKKWCALDSDERACQLVMELF